MGDYRMKAKAKTINILRGADMAWLRWPSIVIIILLLYSCASVPAQIAKLHQKEYEIIASLQKSHLAMVDAYVDQKILAFESFFFKEYGPSYLKHWQESFKAVYGRDYDESRDFNLLYSDLVAEYQVEVAPIEKIRSDLKEAIVREYRHLAAAHEAVDGWINSVEKLNSAQREAFDHLLGAIKPGLSLDSVDKAINEAIEKARSKISQVFQ
jgi:hypothetical protein